jgi:hypothetical protein
MDFSARAGTVAAAISIIGVDSGTTAEPPTTADWSTGTDRPLFAMGAYYLRTGSYWVIKNIRATTTSFNGFYLNRGVLYNCKSENTSATADRYAFQAGSESEVIACEGASTNGRAIELSTSTTAICCYAHDSTGRGFGCSNNGVVLTSCIADTCGVGFEVATRQFCAAVNCTIYNCTTGISGTTGWVVFLNNIIDACTTGASWTSNLAINWFDYNCWDNTTDVSNVTKGPNAQTGDPGLNDPANGDFSITSADAKAYNVGLDVGDLTGATV